jgi:hypothetical protein
VVIWPHLSRAALGGRPPPGGRVDQGPKEPCSSERSSGVSSCPTRSTSSVIS